MGSPLMKSVKSIATKTNDFCAVRSPITQLTVSALYRVMTGPVRSRLLFIKDPELYISRGCAHRPMSFVIYCELNLDFHDFLDLQIV